MTSSDKVYTPNLCVLCKVAKHPPYACTKFRALPHPDKLAIIKANDLCLNCLKPAHFVKQCKSSHHCKIFQKPHHSLLHVEGKSEFVRDTPLSAPSPVDVVTSHAAMTLKTNALLVTCKLYIEAPNGSMIEARALLDSASSVSFVSEHIVQTLRLTRSRCRTKFSGIAGITHPSNIQSVANFNISPSIIRRRQSTLQLWNGNSVNRIR